jgi:hypothetical protein
MPFDGSCYAFVFTTARKGENMIPTQRLTDNVLVAYGRFTTVDASPNLGEYNVGHEKRPAEQCVPQGAAHLDAKASI